MASSPAILRAALIPAVCAFCLFGGALGRQPIVALFAPAWDAVPQWILMAIAAAWCAVCTALAFSWRDLWLLGLLLIAIGAYFLHYTEASVSGSAVTFVTAVAVGRSARLLFRGCTDRFIAWTVALLACSAGCRPDWTNNHYEGPRWMGLWGDPNTYGALMGAAVVLSACVLAGPQPAWRRAAAALGLAMTGTGLICSFSRGAWCGAAAAGFYLWSRGRIWIGLALATVLVASAIAGILCWKTGSNSWYAERFDLYAGSARHRLSAWEAAEAAILRHPEGAGWNRASAVCGNRAVNTNDYLVIGVELGGAGLLCLCYHVGRAFTLECRGWSQIACRGAAIVFLVSFWFDGGLFDVAPAGLFWALLESSGEPALQYDAKSNIQAIS